MFFTLCCVCVRIFYVLLFEFYLMEIIRFMTKKNTLFLCSATMKIIDKCKRRRRQRRQRQQRQRWRRNITSHEFLLTLHSQRVYDNNNNIMVIHRHISINIIQDNNNHQHPTNQPAIKKKKKKE